MLLKSDMFRRSMLESSLWNGIFKYKSTHTNMNEWMCEFICVQSFLHSFQFSKLLWFTQKFYLRSSFQVPSIAHIMSKAMPKSCTTPPFSWGKEDSKPRSPSQAFEIKTSKFKLRGKDTITRILLSQEEKVNICKAFKPQEFRDTSHRSLKKQLVSYRAKEREG